MRPVPEVPGPGQASAWDYPRPPALQAEARELRVVWLGREIARTTRGYRVLETSHPPVYYLPLADVCREVLAPSRAGMSWCEWKGAATYWDLVLGEHHIAQAAWSYEAPTPDFAPIAGHIAFYAGKVDACYVGEVQAQPQPGGFYGGWVTPDVVGPFKGAPGSWGW